MDHPEKMERLEQMELMEPMEFPVWMPLVLMEEMELLEWSEIKDHPESLELREKLVRLVMITKRVDHQVSQQTALIVGWINVKFHNFECDSSEFVLFLVYDVI